MEKHMLFGCGRKRSATMKRKGKNFKIKGNGAPARLAPFPAGHSPFDLFSREQCLLIFKINRTTDKTEMDGRRPKRRIYSRDITDSSHIEGALKPKRLTAVAATLESPN